MPRKRCNPDWGKPEVNAVPYRGATSFEEIVKKLRLSPTEYEDSLQLKDWVRKNKDQKYVRRTCWKHGGWKLRRTPECRVPHR